MKILLMIGAVCFVIFIYLVITPISEDLDSCFVNSTDTVKTNLQTASKEKWEKQRFCEEDKKNIDQLNACLISSDTKHGKLLTSFVKFSTGLLIKQNPNIVDNTIKNDMNVHNKYCSTQPSTLF